MATRPARPGRCCLSGSPALGTAAWDLALHSPGAGWGALARPLAPFALLPAGVDRVAAGFHTPHRLHCTPPLRTAPPISREPCAPQEPARGDGGAGGFDSNNRPPTIVTGTPHGGRTPTWRQAPHMWPHPSDPLASVCPAHDRRQDTRLLGRSCAGWAWALWGGGGASPTVCSPLGLGKEAQLRSQLREQAAGPRGVRVAGELFNDEVCPPPPPTKAPLSSGMACARAALCTVGRGLSQRGLSLGAGPFMAIPAGDTGSGPLGVEGGGSPYLPLPAGACCPGRIEAQGQRSRPCPPLGCLPPPPPRLEAPPSV